MQLDAGRGAPHVWRKMVRGIISYTKCLQACKWYIFHEQRDLSMLFAQSRMR